MNRSRLALLVVAACGKDARAPVEPALELPAILQRTFDGRGDFVPAKLSFHDVRPDGTFTQLVVETQRKPTGGPFDPDPLFHCPTTTWRGGRATVNATGSCAMWQPAPPPRCRLVEVWARAIEEGAKPGTATVTYEKTAHPMRRGATWIVAADRRVEFEDDCAAVVEAGSPPVRRLPQPPAESPPHVDELLRLATAWLADRHPTLVPGRLVAVGVGADGTLDPSEGSFFFLPAVVWPDGKPPLDTYHYGGAAPHGICRELTWTPQAG